MTRRLSQAASNVVTIATDATWLPIAHEVFSETWHGRNLIYIWNNTSGLPGSATFYKDFNIPSAENIEDTFYESWYNYDCSKIDCNPAYGITSESINGHVFDTTYRYPTTAELKSWLQPGDNRIELRGTNVLNVNLIMELKFPGGIEIEATEAFSPNDDGIKDQALIQISNPAMADWTLSVNGYEGYLKTSQDFPNQDAVTFNWDGKLNGVALPDGKYTLRIKVGSQKKTVDVIIDTKGPEIRKINIEPNPDGNGVHISAKIKDVGPERQCSGINQNLVMVNSNGTNIGIGAKEYSSETNVFSQRLSEDDISTLNLPYVEETNNISVTVEDLAGNKSDAKLDLPADTDIKNRVNNGKRSLLTAITVGKTVFRPLLNEINAINVIPRKPGSAIGNAVISFYSVTIYRPNPNPNREWVLWKVLTFPPYTKRSIYWDGKDPSTGRPLPEGEYTITGRHVGFQKTDEYKIKIDNRRIYNWRDGDNSGDANQRVHILWGSANNRENGLFHNWHFFAPVRPLDRSSWPSSGNPTKAEKDRSFVTEIYRGHLLTPIRYTVNPIFQTVTEFANGGVNARYESELSDALGSRHRITARTRRYLDKENDIIIERVEDAYVD